MPEKRVQSFSMRMKLTFAFVVITAVPLVVTTIFSSFLSHKSLVQQTFKNNHTVAVTLSREIDRILDARVKLLMITAENPGIQSMNTTAQLQELRTIARHYPDMNSLIVADHTGAQTVRTVGQLANIADRAYFKDVMKGPDFVISDTLKAKGTGLMSVIIAVPIKEKSNTIKGVLLGVIDLQHLSQYVAQTKIGQTGYAFLADRYGKALAHPNKELVDQETDLRALESVKLALSGQNGASQYVWEGQEKLAGYSPVSLTGWAVVAQQEMAEAMADANKIRWTGIVVTLVAIILATLAGVWLAGRFTKPIITLAAATAKLAEGDVSVTVDIHSTDELGQLAGSFNRMAANLQTLIRGVMSTAEHVAASAQQLSATSGETERAVSQIAGTMSEFVQGAQQQTKEVSETVGIVDELAGSAQDVAGKAQTAASLSREMAAAAQTGGEATNDAIRNINEIKQVTENTSAAVGSLGEKSQQIGQIVDVITGIAGQTNLLALNAAIEAARAGEQGRGFAVVADEVRKLAEQSEQAARQIADIVREIQEQTGQAIAAMQAGSMKVNTGVEVVKTAGDTLHSIINKVRDSVKAMEEIAVAVEQQVAGTKHVAASTERISVIARQSSANAEHTAAATEEITASVGEISGAAQELAASASELQGMIAKFTI